MRALTCVVGLSFLQMRWAGTRSLDSLEGLQLI